MLIHTSVLRNHRTVGPRIWADASRKWRKTVGKAGSLTFSAPGYHSPP